ncbi:non-specific serine/threonine protein kinase [Trifolium repens]|nr:non-specific serine/threonine protein kinase [Trifolium repens]
MSKVVNWLCGLCKLVPNHSWSGFNINYPWMMVETVGRPVEPRNGQLRRPVGLFMEEGNFGGLVWMLDCQSLHCDIQEERLVVLIKMLLTDCSNFKQKATFFVYSISANNLDGDLKWDVDLILER